MSYTGLPGSNVVSRKVNTETAKTTTTRRTSLRATHTAGGPVHPIQIVTVLMAPRLSASAAGRPCTFDVEMLA